MYFVTCGRLPSEQVEYDKYIIETSEDAVDSDVTKIWPTKKQLSYAILSAILIIAML